MFPDVRLRRNRRFPWLRDMVAETILTVHDLILPLFVTTGENKTEAIESMPGIYRYSPDQIVVQAKKAQEKGIRAIILFPHITDDLKDSTGSEACNPDNIICTAIRKIKNAEITIGIICDVALDPYTSHGHDGIIKDNDVDNDATIPALCDQSLVLAKAGADLIAPSDMMDGRIGILRSFLDNEQFENVGILAYTAKYASNFYGPFRSAIGSSKSLGKACKRTYQMDYRNKEEAIREAEMDLNEGADILMVKPAGNYLDIIHNIKTDLNAPVFAYQVSGEYAMIRLAATQGLIDWSAAMIESLTAIKRAGASAIITYAALDAAEMLAALK